MKRGGFLDLRHPMFRPVWSRALAVALIGGWALWELSRGQLFWAILFGAAAGWMAYSFFVAFDPAEYGQDDEEGP